MKTIEVVAAIVIKEDKILCTQRNESKLDYIFHINGSFLVVR